MTYARSPTFDRGVGTTSVLIMPVDIELSEVTAGGLNEPQAQWTEQAKTNLLDLLTEELQRKNVRRVDYRPPTDPERERSDTQVLKLNEEVGRTIMAHYFLPKMRGNSQGQLPTKTTFDWSLGPSTGNLREEYDSNYALFIFMRDSYASAGRVAVMVITALLTRTVPGGGAQLGFASLVDLRTGDVVWFSQIARTSGDLRTREAAKDTVTLLLKDFPK